MTNQSLVNRFLFFSYESYSRLRCAKINIKLFLRMNYGSENF